MENCTAGIEAHCLEGGMREQAVCGIEVGCEVPGVVGDGEGGLVGDGEGCMVGDGEGCMVGDGEGGMVGDGEGCMVGDKGKGSEGVGGCMSAVVGMEPED